MHDPQQTDLALIPANDGKLLRVLGPGDARTLPVVLVLDFGDVCLATARPATVVVVLLSVGRELNLCNIDLFFGLLCLVTGFAPTSVEDQRVVGAAHHPEVVLLGEDDGLSVR